MQQTPVTSTSTRVYGCVYRPQEDSSSPLGQSTSRSQTHSDIIQCAFGHLYWFIGQSTNESTQVCQRSKAINEEACVSAVISAVIKQNFVYRLLF